MSASLYDKVLVLPVAGLIVSKTIAAAVTGPFRGPDGAPTYGEHIINTMMRGVTTNMRIETAQ